MCYQKPEIYAISYDYCIDYCAQDGENMTNTTILLILFALVSAACIHKKQENKLPPLKTVDSVDLQRYTGEWYEISRYPNRFQKDCPASKATYTTLPNGKINVLNECYDLEYNKVIRSVEGTAKVVDQRSFAKLKVTFFWPFYGDYWIIDLGKDYEYAVVGNPQRNYLWILSRSPEISAGTYSHILENIKKNGYDPENLIRRVNSGA